MDGERDSKILSLFSYSSCQVARQLEASGFNNFALFSHSKTDLLIPVILYQFIIR